MCLLKNETKLLLPRATLLKLLHALVLPGMGIQGF